ncbi:hypothetical protein [Actinacidiphila epipremni]|uniref:Uncharacterized protein n=1 Tax=Actinacidiphila epipremni TaxID=2053013 RepID=A0ABX0ZHA9_9ACTN|nr:hypothetical protein [Actinacidiphila epipremni]NJP42527.1 hypothetical protein [Actinacidiphila epipremni]
MKDRFTDLYPAGAADLPVAASLAVPRFPAAAERRNDTGVDAFYAERLLAAFRVPGTPDRIALVDKLFPHARFDAMWLAADDEPRTATTDMARAGLERVLSLGRDFVRYVRSPATAARYALGDAAVHLCFNYDRDTVDRDNAMFYDKRFHLHMNCWPERDLEGLSAQPYGSIADPVMRRRLIDPLAYLGARVLRDLTGPTVEGQPTEVEPDRVPGAPVGLAVRLAGWDALAGPVAAGVLRTLHRGAEQAYAEVRAAFVGSAEPSGVWQRPALLPEAEVRRRLAAIGWLGPDTAADLLTLRNALRDLGPGEIEAAREDPRRAVRSVTLAGLDYSVGMSQAPGPEDAPVLLTLQPRLLGDVGGAGLPPLRGLRAVRLDRRSGAVMTDGEIAERSAFLLGYLASLGLGDTAVPPGGRQA